MVHWLALHLRCQGECGKDTVAAILLAQVEAVELHLGIYRPLPGRWAHIDARQRDLARGRDDELDGQRAANAAVEVQQDGQPLLVEREVVQLIFLGEHALVAHRHQNIVSGPSPLGVNHSDVVGVPEVDLLHVPPRRRPERRLPVRAHWEDGTVCAQVSVECAAANGELNPDLRLECELLHVDIVQLHQVDLGELEAHQVACGCRSGALSDHDAWRRQPSAYLRGRLLS